MRRCQAWSVLVMAVAHGCTPFPFVSESSESSESPGPAGPANPAEGFSRRPIELTAGASMKGRPGSPPVERPVIITGDNVSIENLRLTAGLTVTNARAIRLRGVQIAAGTADHAVAVVGAELKMADAKLECGKRSCIRIEKSHATLTDLTLDARGQARGIRVVGGRIDAERLDVVGGRISQVQVEADGLMRLRDSALTEAAGSGLVILSGARLDAARLMVSGAANMSVVLVKATASLKHSKIGAAGDLTFGIQGAKARVTDTVLMASSPGTINIAPNRGIGSDVAIVRSRIHHGASSGITMTGSLLEVRDTEFVGERGTKNGEEALVALGSAGVVKIDGMKSVHSTGLGILLANGARGEIRATVESPAEGGVQVENTKGPVRLHGVRVAGCRSGAGIQLIRSSNVSIEDTEIERCAQAGIEARGKSSGRILRSQLKDNAQHGVFAVEGSRLELRSTFVQGSRIPRHADCAADSEITMDGGPGFCQIPPASLPPLPSRRSWR